MCLLLVTSAAERVPTRYRRALVQDTGLSTHLPSGEGLLAFSSPEEALDGSLPEVKMDFPEVRRHQGGMGLGWIIGLFGGIWISLLLILLVARMMR